MKLFTIADIHGALNPISRAEKMIREADAVLIAGDLTRHGAIRDAIAVLDLIGPMNPHIIAVPGNWDGPSVVELLGARGCSIHGSGKTIGNVAFFGCGGALRSMIKTPLMFTEDELIQSIEKAYQSTGDAKFKLMLTHVPPHGLRDRTIFRSHPGSVKLRGFIGTYRVDVVVCGHVHEAAGVERHFGTLIVNPGSFKKGKYALIDISDSIKVELKSV